MAKCLFLLAWHNALGDQMYGWQNVGVTQCLVAKHGVAHCRVADCRRTQNAHFPTAAALNGSHQTTWAVVPPDKLAPTNIPKGLHADINSKPGRIFALSHFILNSL